jgi:hypothetical protein
MAQPAPMPIVQPTPLPVAQPMPMPVAQSAPMPISLPVAGPGARPHDDPPTVSMSAVALVSQGQPASPALPHQQLSSPAAASAPDLSDTADITAC